MSDSCLYAVTNNPKFYIKDEYGNLKEFGKFTSADTDLITGGEGSIFFEDENAKHIRTITNNPATFNCDIDNIDLSFIWSNNRAENKKSIQIAELKYHLSMEAKNGNLLSNVVLEGLNRSLIDVDKALYFVSNGWKRMHGFPVTRYKTLVEINRNIYGVNKTKKKNIKQEIICDIFNKKLGYLCQFMYNNQTIIYKPDYLNDDIGFDDFCNGVIKGFNKLW